jgi:hypothetical protein
MLDTSYGFNNLLKEVPPIPLRDTNTSQGSKKSFLRTSMPARRSVPKSKDHSDPSVRLKHLQNAFQTQAQLCQQPTK